MKCQFCNTELEDDALFCHECGAKTGESPAEEPGEEMRKCSGCGAELNPEAKFCSHCGTPAAGQSPVRKSDKSSRFSVDQIRVFTEKVIEKIKEKPKRSAIIAAAAAAVIVLLIIVSILTGGNSPAPTSSAGGSSSYSASGTGSGSRSDDYYELIATRALYEEIQSKYSAADPGSTKYKINKTEKKGNDTVLYGKLYLYDKYGKSTTGYSDGSGSYIRSFTVEIDNDTGKAVSCTIK